MNRSEYVTASEIQEYVYCKRAWWLHFHGKRAVTQEMKAGTIAHEQMAKQVLGFDKRKRGVQLVIISVLLLVLLYILLRLVLPL